MATRPSVADTVTRWQQGTQSGQQKYIGGIQTSKDWAGNFTAAEPQMIAGLQAAIADGRITRGAQRLGTAGWRAKTLAKGPTAWLTGVNNATAAATAGFQKLFGFLDQADNAISNIPRGDFNANMNRMTTYVTTVHNAAVAAKATA